MLIADSLTSQRVGKSSVAVGAAIKYLLYGVDEVLKIYLTNLLPTSDSYSIIVAQ